MGPKAAGMVMGLVAAACVSQPVRAAQGDWLFRVGVGVLNPKESNLSGALGGDLVFDDAAAPFVSTAYMLTDHISTELLLPWPFSHGIDLKTAGGGVARAADADLFPPTLSLQWHFNPDGPLRPYVGAGINYTMFSGEELRSASGLPDGARLDIDGSFGAALQAGIDLDLNDHWFVNAQVRWIDMDADAEVDLPAGGGSIGLGNFDVDPFMYGVAFGYRIRAAKPTPAPAPAPVAAPTPVAPPPPPPAKCSDGDNDGVCDADDKCPGTPAGIKVDSVGCPLEQRLKLLFDFDSAELRPESLGELERLVKFMGDVPFATALIEGHTDSVGTDAYNQSLSDRRAKAVFDYLSSRGVDPARLKSMGKGESEPIADNKTAEGRQENRRVLMIRTDSGR